MHDQVAPKQSRLSGAAARERILAYFTRAEVERRIPPTIREVADAVGLSSSTVNYHISTLVRNGVLMREPGISRGVRLAKDEATA